MTDRTKSQRWTIITQSSDPVASSRRRAAERVRQRLNRDKKQWNIYGKKPFRKPKSRTQSRIHSTPWNDRFIFDEDNELAKSANGAAATNLCNGSTKTNKEATDTNHKRISEFNRIQPPLRKISSVSIDSQKINETQASGQSAGEVTGSIIRYYTERSDGEKVMEFQRHEIIPMPSSRSSKPNPSVSNLIGTCNVAVSPFDAAKVSAALEDYAVRNGHKKQYSSKVDLSNETNTALLSNVDYFDNQLTRLALTQGNEDHKFIANDYSYKNKVLLDLQGLNTISLLEIIEEILYAMELEEDLVFQALVERKNAYFDEFNVSSLINVDSKISNNHSSDQSDFKECGDLHGEDQCNVLWQPMDEQCNEDMEEESVRRRRKDAIIQYITKERLFRDTAEMPLMQSAGLPFHEIIEMLSDSVVDSCINDIASELDSIIQNISHDICRII